MKSLVVYSSRTGNTEKVARAIADCLPRPCDLLPVDQAPDLSAGGGTHGYDFVALGFWVDKGGPDAAAAKYMQAVKNCRVGLFGTLGAWPDSDHARDCIRRAEEMMAGNEVLGSFLCQGRIDPAVIAMMQKMASDAHPMTPERIARIREAERHPDEKDLADAQVAFRAMADRLAATAATATAPGDPA